MSSLHDCKPSLGWLAVVCWRLEVIKSIDQLGIELWWKVIKTGIHGNQTVQCLHSYSRHHLQRREHKVTLSSLLFVAELSATQTKLVVDWSIFKDTLLQVYQKSSFPRKRHLFLTLREPQSRLQYPDLRFVQKKKKFTVDKMLDSDVVISVGITVFKVYIRFSWRWYLPHCLTSWPLKLFRMSLLEMI